MRTISAHENMHVWLGAVLIVKYCGKFVENTKKAMFFLEKHVIRGGGGCQLLRKKNPPRVVFKPAETQLQSH